MKARRRRANIAELNLIEAVLPVFPHRKTVLSLFEREVLFNRGLKFTGQFQPPLRRVEAALKFEHPAGHFLTDLRKRSVHSKASLGDWNERKSVLDHLQLERRKPGRNESAMAAKSSATEIRRLNTHAPYSVPIRGVLRSLSSYASHRVRSGVAGNQSAARRVATASAGCSLADIDHTDYSMRILVLGGSQFLGRAIASHACAADHDVTCAARGLAGPIAAGARLIRIDRDVADGLAPLAGETFDAVVDVSRHPGQVGRAVAALGGPAIIAAVAAPARLRRLHDARHHTGLRGRPNLTTTG
ncbi:MULTISPECIES: hypothetical protein [unclassified Bradyrhizobium]|uniref:hypothetical protein n=1 Tax=unclassified Bradyrhizobium TaxID=2631580 RepID=UPI00211E2E64|nr:MULTISPECIES: hypothetical protein [unclassified Bradyrhizobium]